MSLVTESAAIHTPVRGALAFVLVLLAAFGAGDASGAEKERRYWYAARAFRFRPGFTPAPPSIAVFDIGDGHRLVRNIPLPEHVVNIKGIAASAVTRRIYVGHWGDSDDLAEITCLDLVTGEVIWEREYAPGPGADRFALSPDGKRLYMPTGETGWNSYWIVADAITGDVLSTIDFVSAPHNTLLSLDGKHVYLQSHQSHICPDHEATPLERMIAIADTATDKIVRTIGPFGHQVRPFTIDGRERFLFAIINNLIGFQVADIASNRVLYTARPPAELWPQPTPQEQNVWSHGIALSPDEKEVWICDQKSFAVHAFDVSGLPAQAPRYVGSVKTATFVPRAPGWINMSLDGRYVYPETGEVIERATRKVVATLLDPTGAPFISRWTFEADFRGDEPLRAGDQFSVGRVLTDGTSR